MSVCGWKSFLRAVEAITAALVMSNIAAYGLVMTGYLSARSLEPFVAISMFVLLLVMIVLFILLSEAGRVPKTILKGWRLRLGLRFRWCPQWLMALSWSVTVAFALALPSGKVYWDFADPLTEYAARVFTGTEALFASLLFPVIVSASRMPGTYLQAARRMSVGPNNAVQGDGPRPAGSDRA